MHPSQVQFYQGAPNKEGPAQCSPPHMFVRSHRYVTSPRDLVSSDFIVQRPCDPPPSLISLRRASEDTTTRLRMEQRALQLQLRSLQHHLSLHKLHVRYTNDTKKTKRRMDDYDESLRRLGERRKVLIASHSTSIRGSHAREYRALLAEHVHLEDQFRQITASRIVAHYNLQQLVIDAANSRNNTASSTVGGSAQLHPLY